MVANIYRTPPKSSLLFNDFLERFESFLTRINLTKKVFIAGDFNIDLKKKDWTLDCFEDLVLGSGLTFLNSEPTRKEAVLDNFIIREIDKNQVESHVRLLDFSDHSAISLFLKVESVSKNKNEKIRKIFCDTTKLQNNTVASEFFPIYSMYDVNDKMCYLTDVVTDKINSCCSVKYVSSKSEKTDSSWVTDEIRCLSNKKKQLFIAHKHDPSNLNLKNKYIEFKKSFKSLIRQTKIEHKRKKLRECNGNSKSIWRIINQERNKKSASPIIPKLSVEGKNVTEVEDVVHCFAKQFNSINKKISESHDDLKTISDFVQQTIMCFDPIPSTSIEVFNIIHSLNSNKSTGIDCISVKVVKSIAFALSGPLSDIFNASLLQGSFPDLMKVGKITPIYKKGDHSDVQNYRPITILPVFSKILERLMYYRLYSYLESNKLLNESQFGFRRGKSTQNAILKFLEKIYRALDCQELPIGILFDLSKAFDSISHSILLKKLESYGINCINWFKSYLSDRSNCVVIRNDQGFESRSSHFSTTVGVPQGSILGPLLFIIYVNDAIDLMQDKCNFVVFADDSNAVSSVKKQDNLINEIETINSSFEKWVSSNGLTLNKNKTNIMVFSSKITELGDLTLTNSAKFLGIEVDSKLKFDSHVESVCKKLRSAIYCIRNIRDWAGQDLLVNTYHALIQSHLSYGILAWGHQPQCRIDRILRLQKWAIRTIKRKQRRDSCRNLFKELGILTFPALYIFHVLVYAYNQHFEGKTTARFEQHSYNLRNNFDICTEKNRLTKT